VRSRDGLSWGDSRLQLVDLQYSDVRPDKGLYARLAARGRFERIVEDAEVERAVSEPPEDTRAYFRGRCLAKYGENVAAASWDSVIFDIPGRGAQFPFALTIAAVARGAPLAGIALVAQMGGQLGIEHLLQRSGEEPRENPLFAKEVIDTRGAR